MMDRLREFPCRMLARTAVQPIQCATMTNEVVEVAAESEEDVRFRYSGKNPMRFAVFWCISVRFCGFLTPLTPPSILQTLRGSHLNNFPRKTLKLDWVALHSVTFRLKCLDFNLINLRNSSQSSHVSAIACKAHASMWKNSIPPPPPNPKVVHHLKW